MKKAIIIGSSTGIGYALAYELCQQGWEVGVTSRDAVALKKFSDEWGAKIFTSILDLHDPRVSMDAVNELIQKMNGVDLFIFNAGILPMNPNFQFEPEIEGVRVNVIGFQAMCQLACHFFEKQGHGHFVGISSIAALRGTCRAPSYNASKAFMSIYMEGLRQRYWGTKIQITDIRPGLIATPMTAQFKSRFMAVSAKQAAWDILQAVTKSKKVAYVPARWWWVAQIFKNLPEWIYHPLYKKIA